MGCKQSTEKGVRYSQPVADPPAAEPTADCHVDPTADLPAQQPPPAAATNRGQSSERNDTRGTHRDVPAATTVEHHDDNPVTEGPTVSLSKFKNGRPALTGGQEFPCFEKGLLWRIVKDDLWAFYNDTQEYEMYVQFRFGPESTLTALGSTAITVDSDGWHVAKVIVYPGDTEHFFKGTYNGYKSSIAAKPLSQEYRNRVNAAANEVVSRQLESVKRLACGSDDETLAACLAENVPFVDLSFPPQQESLSRAKIDARQVAPTAWRRPQDFLPSEQRSQIAIFVGGVSPNDIDQGQLGDCWLLCAIAAVAEFPSKIKDMFVHPQSRNVSEKEQKIGAYRVIINKHGWWHNVIVDDFFPTVGPRQCFAHTVETPGELWASLIEKAYAKLHGSYSSITGGDALQALQDLTGFPCHRIDAEWEKASKDPTAAESIRLFDKLVEFDAAGYLFNLNTPGTDNAAYMGKDAGSGNSASFEEMYKKAGLAMGHAYTCIAAKKFDEHGIRLLKIRNPWGNGVEWTGDWSDSDARWTDHPDVAQACKHEVAADGTFWMTFEDALKYFDGGGVCFLKNNWFDYRAKGAFVAGFPNLALEVTVTKPVKAFCIFAQKDKRGLPSTDPDSKYAAVMLSVVRSAAAARSDQQQKIPVEVHLNSSATTDAPTKEYTFNYSRDLAMEYTFLPENSPYYVVPRVYETGSNKNYTLGLIADTKASTSALSVNFKTLDKQCRVFQNYPKFMLDTATMLEPFSTHYQLNPERGAPITKQGTGVAL
jgi:hypothetical protein